MAISLCAKRAVGLAKRAKITAPMSENPRIPKTPSTPATNQVEGLVGYNDPYPTVVSVSKLMPIAVIHLPLSEVKSALPI